VLFGKLKIEAHHLIKHCDVLHDFISWIFNIKGFKEVLLIGFLEEKTLRVPTEVGNRVFSRFSIVQLLRKKGIINYANFYSDKNLANKF
jgi:hypothetical protein